MTHFTPLASLVGGLTIGLAVVMLMALNGRVAGVSGILGRLLPPYTDREFASRFAFVAGLVVAPMAYWATTGSAVIQTVSSNVPLMIVAGLLVGFGTTLGGGCTSGHGVCGLSRFSIRSLAAVATFMAAGFVTVFILRHGMGG